MISNWTSENVVLIHSEKTKPFFDSILTDDATRATVMASDVNVTGIVFGAIFGGIFIMTCIISAVKAVRWVVYLYQSTVLFS